jgi:hypothetical protein
MSMAMGWKDWLTGCSVALTAGVLAGTLHTALGHSAAPAPMAPASGDAVLPAPEDDAQLTRPKAGTVHSDRQAAAGAPSDQDQSAPATRRAGQPAVPAGAAAPPKAGVPRGADPRSHESATPSTQPTPPAPTDSAPPTDPTPSDEPPAPTPTAAPTDPGGGADPGQPTDPVA